MKSSAERKRERPAVGYDGRALFDINFNGTGETPAFGKYFQDFLWFNG